MSKNKKIVEKEITLYIFIPSSILFFSICIINIPFAFFYTNLFIHFNGYKNTNYLLYYNFMLTSIITFSYFLLMILSIYSINHSSLHGTV